MSTVSSPRELVAACMDFIALEGSTGISIVCLFSSIDPLNDVLIRRQVWSRLRSSRGVLNFFQVLKSSKKRPRPGMYNKKQDEIQVKQEMQETTTDAKHSGKTVLGMEELELLTYEEATAEQQLMVVACEELRHRALNIPLKAIAADLGDTHFRILEAVGRARAEGITVTMLIQLVPGTTVKRLHSCLDVLISNGLVVKRLMIVARPTMRRLNIIHLPRFASAFKPQMFDESADFESDEQSKKILCAAAEKYLKGLPTHSSVLADLGRDLSLRKRHLEVLRSQIMQECKVNNNYPLELFQAVLQPPRRASLEPKILNCVRYKPPHTRTNAKYRRGIVLELGLLSQIYGIIEDSAENGTTIIDLRNQIVLPGSKMPYKLVSVLAGMYSLKAEIVILGKNKAFRLYLSSMAPCTSIELVSSTNGAASTSLVLSKEDADEETSSKVKIEKGYAVRSNTALKLALRGMEVDGTSARRREHILERLEAEKIISLSSLRASVFSMEKQRAKTTVDSTASNSSDKPAVIANQNTSMSCSTVGKADTRSIFRIATELEHVKKLRLLQLPLPARNVSTKFRALHCVVAPGYEHNEVFIQGFVKNYCRDERLRRIHRNAGKDRVVHFHTLGSDYSNEGEDGRARKKRRVDAKPSDAHVEKVKDSMLDSVDMAGNHKGNVQLLRPTGGMDTEGNNATSPALSYKVWRFGSKQKCGVHSQQFRKLGFAYGVMYRCKVLHQFLWKALHEDGSRLQLPGEDDEASVQDMDSMGDGKDCAANEPLLSGIVFSRESVLHSMPVHLYIHIFSGGAILTDAEFARVEHAMKHQHTFQALSEELCNKIWSHESERTSKVLGTLADLGLVVPHKIGMKHLVKILRAGYTDGRDGVLSRALNENALGGLFRFNRQARIALDDSGQDDYPFSSDDPAHRSVNNFDSIRLVGLTEKTYSFAESLPLRFSFKSESDVNRYWEALECLCLEHMTMEAKHPRKNEPIVCSVPKPTKTRARRMMRVLAWIPKSQKSTLKHKRDDGKNSARFTSSGIVSTSFRPRKKRRQAQDGDEFHGGSKQKKQKDKSYVEDEDEAELGALTWTDVHEQQLVDYFLASSKSQWRISIPQSLQRGEEHVAFRNASISRSGFGLVGITRKLGKRTIDVKKRLKEKLMEPVVKLLLEKAKREAQVAYNPGGLFDEEVAIQGSTRLTALFRRAVMMIVSPREEYHPLVAEELISFWAPQEIRLVWRYLWLKNWIVRASEKERGRGYCTSQRLQDLLKVTTLSYPLLLFQQAAEQESMVCSTLEEITAESQHRGERHTNDQLFDDNFPTNATPGQCALELGCQVLGTCSLTAVHLSVPDPTIGTEDTLERVETTGKGLPRFTKRESLLTCKSLKGRSGFAAHLANKVNVSKASDLIDMWRVETKMDAVTIEDKELQSACEAFSLEEIYDNEKMETVASENREEMEKALERTVLTRVCESGEEGVTVSALVEQLRSSIDTDFDTVLIMRVKSCLNTLVEQGLVICVNAYYEQRYIGKEHGDVWLLRPFSLVPSTRSSSKPQVVFEGEKDTLSFPWLKMNGGTNYKFLFAIQRKLLALILQAPGLTEKRAHAKMNKLLSLQDTREAMSTLVEEGLVYARAVTPIEATSLFTPFGTHPSTPKVVKLVGSVLAYDRSVFEVHYFPRVECIQRFGSIVQDYQNVDNEV